MAFNTGNPIGSTDARDLSDNAQNFDQAINGPSATWVDRLDNTRISLRGQIGYTGTGSGGAIQSYTSGLVLSGYNVIILYSGEFYRPSASATLPYTTTATLPDVDSNLVSVGDANLRQDLAGDPADGLGSALISGVVIHVTTLSAIKELPLVSNYQASLSGKRSGIFSFNSSDLSAEVTADSLEVLYVAPASDDTGASGAWVRQTDGIYFSSWAGLGEGNGADEAVTFAALCSQMNSYETWMFDEDFTTSDLAEINSKNNIVIDGSNCVITEIGIVDGTFKFTSCNRCRITGFRVFGDETAAGFDYSQPIGPSYYFVNFTSCSDCLSEFNVVTNKSAGFYINAGNDNTIDNCKHIGIFSTPVSPGSNVNGVNSYFVKDGRNNKVSNSVSINSGTGILTGSSTQYAIIKNNYTATDNDNGIYISSGDNVLVEGNTCVTSNRGSGIKCRANKSRVVNNNVTSCFIGITMSGENGVNLDNYDSNGNLSIVQSNVVVDCGIGLNLDILIDEVTGVNEYCRDVMLLDNQLISCGGPDQNGATINSAPIRIKGGPGHHIKGNFINGKQDAAVTKGIFIFVFNSGPLKTGYNISNNTFRGNWEDAIYLYEVKDSIISFNSSISDTVTRLIYAREANNNIITGNSTKTGQCIRLADNSENNIVSYNRGATNLLQEYVLDNILYGNIPTAKRIQKPTLSIGGTRTPNALQDTMVTLSVRAYTGAGGGVGPGDIFVDVDSTGGATNDYSMAVAFSSASADAGFSLVGTATFMVPAGASYTVRNERDPDGTNAIENVVEYYI